MPKENKAGMPYRLDLFIAVISLLFPWGWSVSGFPPSIELACICWAVTLACSLHYFWAWSKNKWRKTERWLVMIIVPVLVLTFSWRPVKNQYHIQHSPSALAPTDPKVLAAVNGVGSNFNALTSLLATNQFDTRLPILASSQKDLFIRGDALQKQHELISVKAVDLKTLRQERENELAIRENQSNQAVIQQKLDAINNEKTQPERQRKAEQAMLQTERFAATNILPVYDYVINDLVKTIDQVARDAGENISSDFRSEAPTIFASNLEREGIIINGKNTISLGTNSVWSFEISTVTKDFSDRKPIPEDFSHISIVCRTTNGNSILTITPKIKNRGRIFYHPNDILIDENVVIERIAIKLNVPNGFNMNEDRDTANYMGEVELAVRRLIEAQDQLCPLTLRTN